MMQHDGTEKNAGERKAAKRCSAQLRKDHLHLQLIGTADSLCAHAPPIETLHAYGLPSLLGVKEGDHAYLWQPGQAAGHAGQVTSDERHDRAAGGVHRVRVVHDIPLKASHPDGQGKFIES
jgi:hypothetical protein